MVEVLDRRSVHNFFVKARLAPGVTRVTAAHAASQVASSLTLARPEGWVPGQQFSLVPTSDVQVVPGVDPLLRAATWLLITVVGLVLLLACTNLASFLVARVLDRLGRQVKVPVLFHYAENDQFFNPKTTRLWFERFSAGGARAEYVLQPAFGTDGHYLFGSTLGVRYWLPTVERFLGQHGVQFARLDADEPDRRMLLAVDRLPNVKTDACRNLYRAFLEAPGPRAYAVSDDGRCGFAGGVENARDAAVRQCGTVAKGNCMVYAVDDSVIWKESVAGQQ